MRLTESQEERFWMRVDRSGGPDACWPWLGVIHPAGYGQMTFRRGAKTFSLPARRCAYMLTYGLDDEELDVTSACGFILCTNPLHLQPQTQSDTMKSSIPARRSEITGKCHQHIALAEDDVRQMCREFAQGRTFNALAKRYGCTPAQVARTIRAHRH